MSVYEKCLLYLSTLILLEEKDQDVETIKRYFTTSIELREDIAKELGWDVVQLIEITDNLNLEHDYRFNLKASAMELENLLTSPTVEQNPVSWSMPIELYCKQCGQTFLIEDEKFRNIIKQIENDVYVLSLKMINEGLPAVPKAYNFSPYILNELMRCCIKPDIYIDFSPRDYESLKEEAKKHFEGSRYNIIKECKYGIMFTNGSGIGKIQHIILRLSWDTVNYIQEFNYSRQINYGLKEIKDIVIPATSEEFENLVMKRKKPDEIEKWEPGKA